MEELRNIQAELKAPKGQYNSFGKYHYRSAEDILEAVKPLLAKYGVLMTITDDVIAVADRIYVKATATITDKDGKTQSVTAYARESAEKKGMDDSQITGTASSYARKYALNGLLLIDDTKDADTDERKIETDARAKKDDKAKTEEVEKQLIDEAKVKTLEQKCKDSGVSVITLLDKCKLKHLEDITEKQFYWLIKNWEKYVLGNEG